MYPPPLVVGLKMAIFIKFLRILRFQSGTYIVGIKESIWNLNKLGIVFLIKVVIIFYIK